MAEFGFRGDGAVVGVVDDFGYWFRGPGFGIRLWEIHAGGLKAVEQDAGAARVEGAGGEMLDDQADGKLDGGAVLG
jgi:hypothetical protein